MNRDYPTARTCPIDPQTGQFQSEVAEFAYANEAAKLGITREQFQRVLQAHNFAEDKSKAEYDRYCEQREKERLGTFRDRVIEEREELAAKFDRLTEFLKGKLHSTLSQDEKDRLRKQYHVMLEYKDILDERIAAFGAVAKEE